MWDNLSQYNIILGSQSPRRKQLLSGLGIVFEQKPMPDIDESFPNSLPGEAVAPYIAGKKSEAYLPMMQADTLLITADTVVIDAQGNILGKPKDETDAKQMLRTLSQSTHRVVTGVVVRTMERVEQFSSTTSVTFGALSREQIDYYVRNYKPLDKAGAYGIQEWIGYIAIEKINGSFYNVMGLPVHQLSQLLLNFGKK